MKILPYIRANRARRRFILAYSLSIVLGTVLAVETFTSVTNVKSWLALLIYARAWVEKYLRKGKQYPRLLK